ncbi:MAG: prepilin-type N-terminal cleavage/methylation domain-containing protein [Candidatus Portiera sp.]|nr:prepilin-type N-terminal cleavage/methylation domain-containing protein [Portiera sp.]
MNNRVRGFTLIELMVAVGLLAILSTLVFSSINSAFQSFDSLSNRGRIQSGFAGVVSILNDDFINISPRAVRTSTNTREAAFVFNDQNSEYLLQFTRSGASIIDGENERIKQLGIASPQVGFSRVAYRFADSTLYRYEWGILDRDKKNLDDFAQESVLIEDVYDVQVIVYSANKDNSLSEQTKWPATALTRRSVKKEFLILPAAVSLRIILEDSREFVLFFPGATGVAI